MNTTKRTSESERGDCYRPFTFTGNMEDEVSGLYYAQAREYDPSTGRFTAKDQIKGFTESPYMLNEYGYCWNNPLLYVDLDGCFPWKQVLIIAGSVVAAAAVTVATAGVGGVAGAAIIGAAVGGVLDKIPSLVEGVTKGSHSFRQVFKSGLTKLIKGQHMSHKVAMKGLFWLLTDGVKGIVVDIARGFGEKWYENGNEFAEQKSLGEAA